MKIQTYFKKSFFFIYFNIIFAVYALLTVFENCLAVARKRTSSLFLPDEVVCMLTQSLF